MATPEEAANIQKTIAKIRLEKNVATIPLRLAAEDEQVKIIALNGGATFHDRLAGMGLRVGETVKVIQNKMDGKMLIGHASTRLYLGGGMAQKIQVIVIEGGKR